MPQDRPVTRHLPSGVLLVLVGLLLWPDNSAAAGTRADTQRLRGRLESLQRGQRFDLAAEETLVAEVTNLVARFRSQGGSGADARALRQLIEDTHGRYAIWLGKRQDETMAADGDLETLQDSPEWRGREELALQTLYSLNWVHLEAATRFESSNSSRTAWLEQAQAGFGQFVVEDDPQLAAESLYGRGVCRRELGQYTAAANDLWRALRTPPPKALIPPIGAALVETLIDADQGKEALTASQAVLDLGASPEAEFLRAKVLLLSLGSGNLDAATRTAYRHEVAALLGRLERRGGKWGGLAIQLAAAGIGDPEEWLDEISGAAMRRVLAEGLRQRGRCDEALPLYESILQSTDEPNAALLLARASCQMEQMEYLAAFDGLAQLPPAEDGDDITADASYLRFKAAEAMYEQAATPESAERLNTAATEYIDRAPEHPQIFEAHFRAGELARAGGAPLEAAARFDAVAGESQLAIQATFEAAQCYVAAWEDRQPPDSTERRELRGEALERLDKFLQASETFRSRDDARSADAAILEPLQARAMVLSALLLTHGSDAQDLERAVTLLDAFSKKNSSDPELASQANLIRGVALLRLGRFSGARATMQGFLADYRHSERSYMLLRRLGAEALELSEQQRLAGDTTRARALEGMALDIYSELLRVVETEDVAGASPEALRQLISTLRRTPAS